MDYSNFVKNFYRQSISRLKDFRDYYGKFVNISKELGVSSDLLHLEESGSKFLPPFSLNINASTKDFVNFMDYYVNLMPDLGVVLADKTRINALYNNIVDMGIIEDDEQVLKYINFVIGVGISTLEAEGILER